jgi:chemotaxis protein methyltransferase WspC
MIESLLRSRGAIAPELLDPRALESLARARCAAGAASSLEAYARVLQSDPREADRLIGEIAVPETWFFRYPSSFELLRSLLSSCAADPRRDVRILSVGCAAGCEPVSIAVAALSAGVAPSRLEVIAVDRNPQAVRDAQQGRWPAHSLREGLPEWSAPWISASRGDPRHGPSSVAHVSPTALERIRWRVADATSEPIVEAGSCVAVFCRNVLIYLNATAREAMLSRLTGALAPQGILFLGHAESMVGRAGLESAGVSGAFAWRRAAAEPGRMAKASSRRNVPPEGRRSTRVPALAQPSALPRAASRAAAARQAPADHAIAVAQHALARGDTASARSALLALAKSISASEQPAHADETELAAGLLSSIGELDAAFALYSRIVFVNPDHDRALLAMAELAECRGRPQEATRYRERLRRMATRQDGKDPE